MSPSSSSQPTNDTNSLRELLATGEYLSYAYSYPHKTAYRTLATRSLSDVWSGESLDAVSLYLHVPFCEQRCGFCNLFTQAQPQEEVVDKYLSTLRLQHEVVLEQVGNLTIAQIAVGGGTPTYLSAAQLDTLLALRGASTKDVPMSVEVSPSTLDEEKVAVLVSHGTSRVSMGVQSFVAQETKSVQRPQSVAEVERSLALLRGRVPVRNVDLIYGLAGQTESTLRESIDRALELGANEIYLYPLYVRPMTILSRKSQWQDERLALYRFGRDYLRSLGFAQTSMRRFASAEVLQTAPTTKYRCQDDGMIGLGAGARSYTTSLHYASPFAVSQANVRARIVEWTAQSREELAQVSHGILLSEAEKRRRYVILSLLDAGIERSDYSERFGADVFEHVPELRELEQLQLATVSDEKLVLTDLGLERADVLGYWLQSEEVRKARSEWALA